MRIAHGDVDAVDDCAVGELDGALLELGHVHVGGDEDGGSAEIGVVKLLDGADARAGIGFDGELVASGGVAFLGHPCGHAARAVAADLGDGAVGVVQADAAGSVAGPCKKLDAVGADAGVALAKALGEDRFVVRRGHRLH